MLTHVAFQTGMRPDSLLARFDFFVPVFFALSAFLLWRRYCTSNNWGGYLWHRAVRILPAYWLTVIAVFLLLPDAFGTQGTTILATAFLAQIYVPDALAPGLTHLWSLCVEVAFYLVLPLIALALRRRSPRTRIVVIIAACALSLGWAYLPFVASQAPGWPNLQIFPVSYACWFGVGLIAAELEGQVRVRGPLWLYWVLALVVAWIAAQPWFGPLGLVHPSPTEFLRRVLAGTVFGALFLLPVAWRAENPLLDSRVFQHLGRWSYGIFLWHVPMLSWAFPLLGILPFTGHFVAVLLITIALTVPVAAASYFFVEQPVLQWSRRVSRSRRAPRTTDPRHTPRSATGRAPATVPQD